jgi:excisionase family DNA binding protein
MDMMQQSIKEEVPSGGGYSIRQVARMTGISERRIRNAIRLKEVPVVTFGGTVRLKKATVDMLADLYRD